MDNQIINKNRNEKFSFRKLNLTSLVKLGFPSCNCDDMPCHDGAVEGAQLRAIRGKTRTDRIRHFDTQVAAYSTDTAKQRGTLVISRGNVTANHTWGYTIIGFGQRGIFA